MSKKSIFPEIYLQYIEHTKIVEILIQTRLIGYLRYVDNILVVYNTDLTNIHEVLDSFNNIMPTMEFTIEDETNNNTGSIFKLNQCNILYILRIHDS
jgi:hypothetical protein